MLTMEYPPMRGGAGVYCHELARSFSQTNQNLTVLGPKIESLPGDADYQEIPTNGSQDWSCSWKVGSFLKDLNFSQTTLHLAEPGALRAWVRFGWRCPSPKKLFITLHGSEIPKFSQNFWERKLFIRTLNKANKIHLLSRHNRDALLKLCPDLNTEIVIQPGAPAKEVMPVGKVNRFYRPMQDGITLLSVGRLHPRKGQLELLQAIKLLPDPIKKYLTCRFIGPLTKKGYSKKIMSLSRHVGCKVEFLGNLTNMEIREEYKLADLFALTSMPMANSVEGLGFVYLEASAHGLPILAHRTGGVEDAVLDNQTGILCNPTKRDELAKQLNALIEDHNLRKRLGVAGLSWAKEHSWAKVTQEIYGE